MLLLVLQSTAIHRSLRAQPHEQLLQRKGRIFYSWLLLSADKGFISHNGYFISVIWHNEIIVRFSTRCCYVESLCCRMKHLCSMDEKILKAVLHFHLRLSNFTGWSPQIRLQYNLNSVLMCYRSIPISKTRTLRGRKKIIVMQTEATARTEQTPEHFSANTLFFLHLLCSWFRKPLRGRQGRFTLFNTI